jgi:hypothetical protein
VVELALPSSCNYRLGGGGSSLLAAYNRELEYWGMGIGLLLQPFF